MKNMLLGIFLFMLANISLASPVCIKPELSSVVYFSNGIKTDRDSAHSSLDLLKKELADTYNGHKLTYALSYNRTSGMATDLAQASAQSGTQNNRRIIRYLNGKNLAPEWFSNWFEGYLFRRSIEAAEEAANHANYYLNDILHGKKVIVVSHSQGNFYVNEAKELLARQLRAGKMSSFAIFGVAVPSDSIGGSPGPYLTNHRDFIQKVPRSLSANWKLHHSDRKVADDVGPIQAHLFNATYMSNDFDIKPALVAGIRAQIDAAVRPAHSCETFNKSILSMVAGSYMSTCGFKPNETLKETQITGTGMIFPDKVSVDLTRIETVLTLSQHPKRGKSAIEFFYQGGANPMLAAAVWDMNRVFQSAKPPWDCSVTDETPPTMIEHPFSISKTMLAPMRGLYRLLPVNSCTYDRVRKNDKPIEFSVDGTTVRLGDMKWSLGAESEAVALFGLDIRNPTAPSFQHDEPGFLFDAAQGNHNVSLYYSRNKEILWLSAIEINKSTTFCNFDMRSQNI